MARRFQPFFQSLATRLLVALWITVAFVLAAHALLSFRATRSEMADLIRTEAFRTSDLIRRATHDGMLLNQLDEVQATMGRMAAGTAVLAIRVYNTAGEIVLSGDPSDIGVVVQLHSTPCLDCHHPDETNAKPAHQSTSVVPLGDGAEAIRHLSVLENEASCASTGCHATPENEPVLGILDVEMSLAPIDRAMRAARRQLVLTTPILLAITGAVVWTFLRRLVHQPASLLHQGTLRVAAGDLTTRIEVRGEHELARLARSFNQMTADLGAARHEVQEWSDTLEQRVLAKTRELERTQRQVLHMEKMASLGELAATVAHEINNPLGGILTYARLVERTLDDQPLDEEVSKEVKRHLRLVARETTRCGEVVRNLLLFARRDQGEKSPIDLREALERSLLLVRHHLEMHHVRLETSIELADPMLLGNAGEIEQAVVALAVNAVESIAQSRDDGGVLQVRLHEADGGGVILEIEDSGAGIPAEVRAQIFEPFFSTKHDQAGVGLGLAVVYGIVQRHGGRIKVDSAPGAGATFRIWLPRQPSAGQAPTDPEATS